MAQRTIAVEGTLTPYKSLFEDRGYRVEPLEKSRIQKVDAVVITGGDENMMGDQAIQTETPVIDARGQTADQVVNLVEETFLR